MYSLLYTLYYLTHSECVVMQKERRRSMYVRLLQLTPQYVHVLHTFSFNR